MDEREAVEIAMRSRPNLIVMGIRELPSCFVIEMVPDGFKPSKQGKYIGGATRVDKLTKKTTLYNPMIEPE